MIVFNDFGRVQSQSQLVEKSKIRFELNIQIKVEKLI